MWENLEYAENSLRKAIAEGGKSDHYYDVNSHARSVIFYSTYSQEFDDNGNQMKADKNSCPKLVKRAKEMRQFVPDRMRY